MNRAGLLLLIISIVSPAIAVGEFRCSAEIKYRWHKDKDATEPLVTFWATAEKRGDTEDSTRDMLGKTIDRERVQAAEACIRRHQNMSGCISSKIAAYGELMQGMTFSARKKIEDSIATDCEKDLGFCKGVEVSDIACVDLNPPPPAEEVEDESGKDKKKKR
jgi:hypothetical protein